MSEKVGVITTGGTIGSVLSGSAMTVDPNSTIVHQEIKKICARRSFDVDVVAALNKNSEDLSPRDWVPIIDAVHNFLSAGVTRIVITHGTDTLAYTAAAVGLLFSDSGARICLTGSYLALSEPDSDGPLNLIAAFRAVTSDETPPGVYVGFRNNAKNSQAAIVPALDLKPMGFDALFFQASYGRTLAYYSPKSGYTLDPTYSGASTLKLNYEKITPESVDFAGSALLQCIAYPGMDFSHFNLAHIKAIVVELYHSGTAPSFSGKNTIVDFAKSHSEDIPLFCATFPSMNINTPYESTRKLISAGALVYADLQPHAIFVLLTIGLAQGKTLTELAGLMSSRLFS
ncbi:MAG: asparaginase [Proteobacteria bacterium]|nr:asparaginase [Pseudomonadota bacterium]